MSDENSRVSAEEDLSEKETESESESLSESESGSEEDEGFSSENESESESEEDEGFSSENEFNLEEERLRIGSDRGTLSSNKRIKETSIDRLSALPDSLLIHILSFLYPEKAASTCVLSKRWQFLWTELPRLDFHDRCGCDKQRRAFVSKVHSALTSHSGNNLEEFSVFLYYDKRLDSYIDVWVDFLVKKMVKKVGLFLSLMGRYEYALPQMMYSNSSLTSLKLSTCIFSPEGTIMWSSLTTLYLADMEILECDMKKILVGCPALITLSLMNCWGFSCLEIQSHSVRKLRVEDWDVEEEALLEIAAPYVHFLDISVYLVGKKFRLRDISSVQTAKFDVSGEFENDEIVGLMSYTKDLFVSLQQIKKLDLGYNAIKVLAMLAANGCQFPQSRQRECLTIEAHKDEESISGILTVLESSPNLETLVIKGEYCFVDPDMPHPPPARGDLDCDLLHLKMVNITNFAFKDDGVPMLKLAQILLKRATVLEKMVIEDYQISSRKSSRNFIKIALTLLSYPRSSQQAVVLLRDNPCTSM